MQLALLWVDNSILVLIYLHANELDYYLGSLVSGIIFSITANPRCQVLSDSCQFSASAGCMCSEVTNHFLAAYLTGDLDVLDSCLQAPLKNHHDIHLYNRLVDEASAGQHGTRSFIAIAQAGQVGEEVFLNVVGCH